MPQIIRDKFAFLREHVQNGRTSGAAVERFISATVTLLQPMLKSETPIIPWTGQKTYHPLLVEIDVRQLAGQTDDFVVEDYFKGCKIAGYSRPILLSCNHRQVWLQVPKQEEVV